MHSVYIFLSGGKTSPPTLILGRRAFLSKKVTLSKYPYLIIGWEDGVLGPGGISGVGSKGWVLTIGVLEVYPHCHSIRAQRGCARSALFSRVLFKNGLPHFNFLPRVS